MHDGKRHRHISKASFVASIATYIAIPLALVFGSIAVGSSSYSAFSATTTSDSTFASGSISLTTNENAPVFASDYLDGGTVDTFTANCSNVTNSGTLPATIRIYAKPTSNPAMNTYIDTRIDVGSCAYGGGTNGTNISTLSCNDYVNSSTIYEDSLSNFLNSKTSFSTGVDTTISPGQTVSYRFFVGYAYDIPNTMQNQVSTFTVNWEAQNS